MLTYARFGSSDQPLDLIRFDVREAVDDVVSTLYPRANDLDITVNVEPGELVADRRYFLRALSNLLDNASRFARTASASKE